MRHILLTQETSEAVKGRHGDHSYLDPYTVQKDGNSSLALPEAVLYDPEYSDVYETLKGCEISDGWEIKVETENE